MKIIENNESGKIKNTKEKELYQDDIFKLAKNAGISGFGEVLGNIIGCASNILITRRIGPNPFGIYILASTILRVVCIFSVAGIESGFIRFVSLFHGRGDRARVKGVILFGSKLVGLISLFFFLLLLFTSNFISNQIFHNPDLSPALMLLLISLPFTTLMTIWLGGIQGFQVIKYRVYVEKLFHPLSRLLFLILFFLLGMKLFGVILASILSAVAGFFIAFWYLIKIYPVHKDQLPPIYENRELIAFSLPVVFSTFFSFIIRCIGLLMLGYFATAKDVGIYGVVDRVIPVIILPLVSLNAIFLPMIAELYGKRDFTKLEGLYKIGTKWAITLAFPIFLTLSIFARPILNIFGTAFTEGTTALIILSISQMIWLSAGSCGPMLVMTGHQNLVLINDTFCALTNIALNYFLIARYGIIGAAVANTICIAAISIVEVIQVYYLFKIHPFRSDMVKPLGSGIFASLFIFFLSRSDLINLSQINVFLLGVLIILFAGFYLASMLILKISDEDRSVINALLARLFLKWK